MRLPKKIKLSGYEVHIKYAKRVMVEKDDCFGIYDPGKKLIVLKRGMSPARKREVFIHEFLHFVEDIYRIKISEENIACFALAVLTLITEIDFWKDKR